MAKLELGFRGRPLLPLGLRLLPCQRRKRRRALGALERCCCSRRHGVQLSRGLGLAGDQTAAERWAVGQEAGEWRSGVTGGSWQAAAVTLPALSPACRRGRTAARAAVCLGC